MSNDQTIRYVQASDIGDMFDVSASIVLRWAKGGKIPAIKLPSGRYCFDPEAVTAALKSVGMQPTILGAMG